MMLATATSHVTAQRACGLRISTGSRAPVSGLPMRIPHRPRARHRDTVCLRANMRGASANPEMLRVQPSHRHDQAIVNGVSRIGYMTGGGRALWVDEDIADVITARDALHRP